MKYYKSVIISLVLILSTVTGLNAEERVTVSTTAVYWFNISEPGSPSDIEIPTEEGRVSSGDRSDTIDVTRPATVIEPITETARRALEERTLAKMSKLHPPLIGMEVNLPVGITVSDKIIIEVQLSFEGGTNSTLCLQIVSIDSGATPLSTHSTVCEAERFYDTKHVISATADPDGVFRFDFTETARKIRNHEMSNKFILKPFMPRDRFQIPEYMSNPFRFVVKTAS
jgi:hypothetical protein